MRRAPIGVDSRGLVHYDSLAKHSYVWPLCGTSYLTVKRTTKRYLVTCVGCIAAFIEYEWSQQWAP